MNVNEIAAYDLAAEVVKLEARAVKYDAQADAARWKAAHLYHEALVVRKIAIGEFAKQVGKSTQHCRAMKKTWATYGATRESGWTFWDHYTVATTAHEDPKDRHRSNAGGRQGMQRRLSTETRTEVEELVRSEEGRELLTEIFTDDANLGGRVAGAIEEATERRKTSFDDRHGRGKGTPSHRQTQLRAVRAALMEARREVIKAQDAAKSIVPLDEDERADVEEYVARVGKELGALDSLARSSGIDAELKDILEGR